MSAAEKLKTRVEELGGRISDAFPAVSSGHDDPMIDGLGALRELDDLLDGVVAVVEAAEQLPEFFYDEEGRPHSFVPLLDALDEALGDVT